MPRQKIVRDTPRVQQAQFRGIIEDAPTARQEMTLANEDKDILAGMILVAELDGWQRGANKSAR